MSAAKVETLVVDRPAPVAPTHREVLSRSLRLSDAAAAALHDEALRVERDRMALATVHSVIAADGYERDYALASQRAARLLAGVIAEQAAERTHGFTRKIEL